MIHHDDTSMQVLELTKKLKHQQPLREDDPERRGVFTTAILSGAEGRPNTALFFTGPYHAGENLGTVLAGREAERPLPIQMCDALSRNMPDDLRVIIANCLVHARRNFVEVVSAFPAEVRYLIECLKKVYQTDAQAKPQHLSAEERLRLHQKQSGPVMEELPGGTGVAASTRLGLTPRSWYSAVQRYHATARRSSSNGVSSSRI